MWNSANSRQLKGNFYASGWADCFWACVVGFCWFVLVCFVFLGGGCIFCLFACLVLGSFGFFFLWVFCSCFVWGFCLLLIKNLRPAFQIKYLDLFLYIIFSLLAPTNYPCFLIASILTHCRKLILLLSVMQHMHPWRQGGQSTVTNKLILLGSRGVCALTC